MLEKVSFNFRLSTLNQFVNLLLFFSRPFRGGFYWKFIQNWLHPRHYAKLHIGNQRILISLLSFLLEHSLLYIFLYSQEICYPSKNKEKIKNYSIPWAEILIYDEKHIFEKCINWLLDNFTNSLKILITGDGHLTLTKDTSDNPSRSHSKYVLWSTL